MKMENLNVLSPELGAVPRRVFEAAGAEARRITLEAWRDRPVSERLLERLAAPLSTQL